MAGIDRRPPSLASADSPSMMRHSSSSDASAVAKPKCGVRFLFFFFRAVFMAAALAIFFVFTGFAAVVLLLVAVGAVRGRERRSMARDDGGGGGRGLSPAQLRGLSWFEFPGVASSRHWTTPDCAVCLVEFKRRERCRSLPSCGHVFHARCVDQWLVRSPGCPICRSFVSDKGPESAETLPANWV